MTIPAHLFVFITGDPNEAETFTFAGHITIDNTTNTATGKIVFKALDESWIAHGEMINFSFDEEQFTGEIGFTIILGIPPFPASIPFGPIPVGVLTQSLTNPNVFFTVSVDQPPV